MKHLGYGIACLVALGPACSSGSADSRTPADADSTADAGGIPDPWWTADHQPLAAAVPCARWDTQTLSAPGGDAVFRVRESAVGFVLLARGASGGFTAQQYTSDAVPVAGPLVFAAETDSLASDAIPVGNDWLVAVHHPAAGSVELVRYDRAGAVLARSETRNVDGAQGEARLGLMVEGLVPVVWRGPDGAAVVGVIDASTGALSTVTVHGQLSVGEWYSGMLYANMDSGGALCSVSPSGEFHTDLYTEGMVGAPTMFPVSVGADPIHAGAAFDSNGLPTVLFYGDGGETFTRTVDTALRVQQLATAPAQEGSALVAWSARNASGSYDVAVSEVSSDGRYSSPAVVLQGLPAGEVSVARSGDQTTHLVAAGSTLVRLRCAE